MKGIGIIGCGAISSSHIRGYLEFPEYCVIRALCDESESSPRKKIEEFGLNNVEIHADYSNMLSDKSIDAVSICTPPATHAKIAQDFLNAGKHVLIEKPLAPSPQECDAILEAAKGNNKIAASVAQNRFLTSVYKVKKIFESGIIGKLNHVQVDSFWWRGSCYYDLFWRGTWASEAGGCTLNHAIHHIDLLLYFAGMPQELFAFIANTSHSNSEVEDLAAVVFRYKNGSLGQLTSSVVHHGEEQKIVLQGEFARISVPFSVSSCVSLSNGFPERNNKLENEIQAMYDTIPALPFEGHTGQIYNFLRALDGLEEAVPSAGDGKNAIELIRAIYKSASSGRAVGLPLSSEDLFYSQRGLLKKIKPFNKKTKNIERFSENVITVGGKNFG